MKNFEKNFVNVINDYRDDYGTDAVLEELFPGQTLGEVLLDMYNLGGIPTDTLEKFLVDEADDS